MSGQPTKVQREALADRVRATLSVGDDAPARGPLARPFKAITRKLSFHPDAKLDNVLSAIEILCVYSRYQNAVAASKILGEIDPNAWDIDYNYIRASIHISAFFAERAADTAAVHSLAGLLVVPAEYRPSPLLMSGKTLRLSFESRPYEGYPIDMTSTIAGDALHDISRLSTMWIFGGSDEWPRERIMAQVDSTIANLHKLKGWEPW